MLRGKKLPDILTAVSQEWEDACANLTKAIETYVGATTALAAATASLPPWTFYNPTPALDIELESLSLGLLELENARVMLANTRNTQCSPISRLAPELLASIFQIVVDAAHPHNIAESENYANPAVKLGHVCSCWRRVVLEAGSLWSCIVFSYEHLNRYEKVLTTVQTQLERARGSPVYLFVSHRFNITTDLNLRSTLNLIKPYMKQLCSLGINFHENEDIESVLECLLDNGTAGSLTRLEISRGANSSPLFDQAASRTLERLDEHLKSVRVLKLQRVAFHWKCAVFEQLDELELDDLYAPRGPNVTQLARIFSAGPNLRHLALRRVYVDEGEAVAHSLVKHLCLENIELDGLDDEDFQRVLSILTLGRQRADITIHSDLSNPALLEAFRLFVSEANIVVFRLMTYHKHQPLHEIIESLPDLKHLALCKLRLGNSDFNVLVDRNTANSTSLVSPSLPHSQTNCAGAHPRIETLWLSNCTIVSDQATLVDAISSLSLGHLHMRNCSIEVKTERQMEDGSMHTTTKTLGINATTKLGIWLTKNAAGRVGIE